MRVRLRRVRVCGFFVLSQRRRKQLIAWSLIIAMLSFSLGYLTSPRPAYASAAGPVASSINVVSSVCYSFGSTAGGVGIAAFFTPFVPYIVGAGAVVGVVAFLVSETSPPHNNDDVGSNEKGDESSDGTKNNGNDGKNKSSGYGIPLSIKLVGSDKVLEEFAKYIKPCPGFTDVIVHGSPKLFGVLRGNKWVPIDQRSLATCMQSLGYKGGPVRLISCKSGMGTASIAQNLANKLGTKVIAPSDSIWILSNGKINIGPNMYRNVGEWLEFLPQKP